MRPKAPRYLRPYQLAQDLHGPDFRTTLWASRKSQRLRFRVLAEIYPLDGRVILDAGCGTGDLLEFLEGHDIRPARYIGVDALDKVIDAAGKRTFATPARFILGDLVADPTLLGAGEPEVIVISGAMNTFGEKLLLKTLVSAFESAGRCLLFNFLSTRHSKRFSPGGDVARRVNPITILELGLRMTPHVIVRHDYYEGHDCTMAWIKEGSQQTPVEPRDSEFE